MEFIKTISDAFQSLTKNFNDRIKSPIGGAFFFSWLIINWKLVYYIAMQTEIPSKKIAYIEKYFLDIYPVLIYPVLASIAYVLLYPVIYNVSNLAWTFIDKNLKTIVAVQIEKKVLLTTEDRQELYNIMRDQRIRHEKELEKLKGQIEALSKLAPEVKQDEEISDGSKYTPFENETNTEVSNFGVDSNSLLPMVTYYLTLALNKELTMTTDAGKEQVHKDWQANMNESNLTKLSSLTSVFVRHYPNAISHFDKQTYKDYAHNEHIDLLKTLEASNIIQHNSNGSGYFLTDDFHGAIVSGNTT